MVRGRERLDMQPTQSASGYDYCLGSDQNCVAGLKIPQDGARAVTVCVQDEFYGWAKFDDLDATAMDLMP